MSGPAHICHALGCGQSGDRRYGIGWACPVHTPAALAGRPEPILDDQPRPVPLWRTLHGAMSGSDIDKTRPGGYVSKQRAQRISDTRDVLRNGEKS